LISQFLHNRSTGEMATDQLLNAIFVAMHSDLTQADDRHALAERLLRTLTAAG
jgi:predicted RNA polymerase sigma factor